MADADFPIEGKRIWIAGHRGMVGSAMVRALQGKGCTLLTASSAELDLRRQADVEAWTADQKPDAVVIASARVGGIHANDTYPAEFLYDNMMIEANIIEAAHQASVEKLLFLGSSCIYPRDAAQPMAEEALLTGPLEATNQWYAIAKIAGIKLCQAYRKQYGCNFISAMPTNLYGPGDSFHPENSHVMPALMRRFHEAATARAERVTVWGTGTPRREFMHVDDCARALVYLLQNYAGNDHINVGSGSDVSIAELASLIANVAGFEGEIAFDTSKPDGTPRKLMDAARLRQLGFEPQITLEQGVRETYAWFTEQLGADASIRGIAR